MKSRNTDREMQELRFLTQVLRQVGMNFAFARTYEDLPSPGSREYENNIKELSEMSVEPIRESIEQNFGVERASIPNNKQRELRRACEQIFIEMQRDCANAEDTIYKDEDNLLKMLPHAHTTHVANFLEDRCVPEIISMDFLREQALDYSRKYDSNKDTKDKYKHIGAITLEKLFKKNMLYRGQFEYILAPLADVGLFNRVLDNEEISTRKKQSIQETCDSHFLQAFGQVFEGVDLDTINYEDYVARLAMVEEKVKDSIGPEKSVAVDLMHQCLPLESIILATRNQTRTAPMPAILVDESPAIPIVHSEEAEKIAELNSGNPHKRPYTTLNRQSRDTAQNPISKMLHDTFGYSEATVILTDTLLETAHIASMGRVRRVTRNLGEIMRRAVAVPEASNPTAQSMSKHTPSQHRVKVNPGSKRDKTVKTAMGIGQRIKRAFAVPEASNAAAQSQKTRQHHTHTNRELRRRDAGRPSGRTH